MEKKFKELRVEIVQNVDNLDNLRKLIDELLCAANSYPLIKKFFWNVSIFLRPLTSLGQLTRPSLPS